MVQSGQPFPFWVRQQSVLQLKVTSAEPASLVRLVAGAEVAVLPRPRHTLAQQNVLKDAVVTGSPAPEHTSERPDTWLRLQV